jgi:hypothetical protein
MISEVPELQLGEAKFLPRAAKFDLRPAEMDLRDAKSQLGVAARPFVVAARPFGLAVGVPRQSRGLTHGVSVRSVSFLDSIPS